MDPHIKQKMYMLFLVRVPPKELNSLVNILHKSFQNRKIDLLFESGLYYNKEIVHMKITDRLHSILNTE